MTLAATAAQALSSPAASPDAALNITGYSPSTVSGQGVQLRGTDGRFRSQQLSLRWLDGPQACMLLTLWPEELDEEVDNAGPR